jgi:hypothetical protein
MSDCLADSRSRASTTSDGDLGAELQRLADLLGVVPHDPVERVDGDDERQAAGLEEVQRAEAVLEPAGVDEDDGADRARGRGRPT